MKMSPRSLPLSLVLALSALLAGCGMTQTKYSDLDAGEAAKRITSLGKEGRRHETLYLKTYDVEHLEEMARVYKTRSDISPESCSICFRDHARALSMLGRHYYYLLQDARAAAEQSPDAGAEARFLKEAEELEKKMQEAFERSHQAFNFYFRHPARNWPIEEQLVRVIQDLAGFQDQYELALNYLDILDDLTANSPSESVSKFIADTRREIKRRMRNEPAERR